MTSYPYLEALFRNVLQKSKAIEGRFFVCPRAGAEINSDTLGQLLTDAAVQMPNQKYPCVLMMPPRSLGEFTDKQVGWERYKITTFWLRSSYHDNGAMAMPNPNTQTSLRPIMTDWTDMKLCAIDFLRVLEGVQRKQMLQKDTFRLVHSPRPFVPVSLVGSDNASGIRLDFEVELNAGCEIADYDPGVELLIVAPDVNATGGAVDPGVLPGGRYDAEYGVPTAPPPGWENYSATFIAPEPSSISIEVLTPDHEGRQLIDFGQGPRAYPPGVLVVKNYTDLEGFTVTVWHSGFINYVGIMSAYAGPFINQGYVGVMPGGYEKLFAGDRMPTLPYIPDTVSEFYLSSTALTSDMLDALLDRLIDSGREHGVLSLLTVPKTYATLSKLQLLESRYWNITAWGLGQFP